MNKRHYEHTLPNIRGSLSNTYEEHDEELFAVFQPFFIELQRFCAEYRHDYKV